MSAHDISRPRIRFRIGPEGTRIVTKAEPPAPDAPPEEPQDSEGLEATPKRRKANSGSFNKGVSGNPAGRPKGAKGMKAIARQALTEKTLVRTARGTKKVTVTLALMMKEIELAAKGDRTARKNVFDFARWALLDEAATPVVADSDDFGEASQAVLDWFADEIRKADRAAASSPPAITPDEDDA